MDRTILGRKSMIELRDIAGHMNMKGFQKLRKAELIDAIVSEGTGAAAAGAGDEGAGDDGARKVLPPTARQDSLLDDEQASTSDEGDGADADADGGDAAEDADAADDEAGDEADDDARGADSSRRRDRSSSRPDQGGRDGSRRRNRSGDGDDQDDADADADADDDDDDDDGQSSSGRKRRSRRDRRRRNRDRSAGDEDGDDGEGDDQDTAGGSDDASSRDQSSRDQQRADSDQGAKGKGGRDRGGRNQRDGNDQSGREQGGGRNRSPKGQSDGDQRGKDDQRAKDDQRGKDDQGGGKDDQGGKNDPGEVRAGVLDILPEGYGFLRTTGYLPSDRDVYVSQGQIRKHGMRRGDVVQGPIRPQRNNEKVPALHHVQQVNGESLHQSQVPERPDFDELEIALPTIDVDLGDESRRTVSRLVDLLTPLKLGHRLAITGGMAVDTSARLRDLSIDLADELGDAHLMTVLLDARPEDIAATAATVPGEVIATGFDHPAESHAQVAELAVERARRLAELGNDVVVVLDSAARLAASYSAVVAAGAKSAGAAEQVTSIAEVKRLLASARDLVDAGSITIITAIPATTAGASVDQAWTQELARVMSARLVLFDQRGLVPDVDESWTVSLDAERKAALPLLERRLFDGEWHEGPTLMRGLLRDAADTATLLGHLLEGPDDGPDDEADGDS